MDVSDQPTIVLSGPIAQRGQASKILRSNGFEIADGDPTHGHGLPAAMDVKELEGQTEPDPFNPGEHRPRVISVPREDKTVGWLTVHGEDIDRAQELMNGLGWTIRRHWLSSNRVSSLLDDIPQSLDEKRVQQMIEEALAKQAK